MARRVWSDMDTELHLLLGRRSDVTETQRGHWLMDAYIKIALEFEHPEIEATTTGTVADGEDDATLVATDLWWPVLVRDTTNGRLLDSKSKDDIEQATKTEGHPSRYYWWAKTIIVDKLVDGATALKVWYIKQLEEPASGESSELNIQFDALIPMYAAVIGSQRIRDLQNAHILDVEAQNYIANEKLPWREAKKDDRGQGVRVRMK